MQTSISTVGKAASHIKTAKRSSTTAFLQEESTSVRETDILWAAVSCTQTHRKALMVGWDEVSWFFYRTHFGAGLPFGDLSSLMSDALKWQAAIWHQRFSDRHLRRLVPVTASSSTPLTQSRINRGRKTKLYISTLILWFSGKNRSWRRLWGMGEMREEEINRRKKAIKVFFGERDHIRGIWKKKNCLVRRKRDFFFFFAPQHCVPGWLCRICMCALWAEYWTFHFTQFTKTRDWFSI